MNNNYLQESVNQLNETLEQKHAEYDEKIVLQHENIHSHVTKSVKKTLEALG